MRRTPPTSNLRAELQSLSAALLRLYEADDLQSLPARFLAALRMLVSPDEIQLAWSDDSRLQRLLGESWHAAAEGRPGQLLWSRRPRRDDPGQPQVLASGPDSRHLIGRVDLPDGAWLHIHLLREDERFDRRSELHLDLLSAHFQGMLARALDAPAQRRRSDAQNLRRAFLSLSLREKDVLDGVMQRMQNREIAEKLGISAGTVKRHLENIYAKLGVSGRAEARLLYGNLLASAEP